MASGTFSVLPFELASILLMAEMKAVSVPTQFFDSWSFDPGRWLVI